MDLMLGASAFCNWQLASHLLMQSGLAPNPSVFDLSQEQARQELAAQLAARQPSAALVLYAPLAQALEQASRQGLLPEQAAALWQEGTEQLIRFCKLHRARVLLVNLADVLTAPQAFAQLCGRHWPAQVRFEPDLQPSASAAAPFYSLLAVALLQSNPQLQSLTQQLAALAQPLVEHAHKTALPNLNQLAAAHQAGVTALQQLPLATEQCSVLAADLAALQQQLQQEQQSLATSTQQQQQLQIQLAELATSHQQHSAELGKENEQLLAQLQQVQQEFESLLQVHQQTALELGEENDQLLNQLQQVQQEFESRLQLHQHQSVELTEENAQLITQLHQVQQNLEGQLQEHRQQAFELKEENGQLLGQLQLVQQKLENQLHASQHQSVDLKEENGQLLGQLQLVQQELEKQLAIYQSHTTELTEENALLLAQLHQVQQDLETKVQAHQHQATSQQAELKQLQQQLQNEQKALAKNQQLQQSLQAKLAKLTSAQQQQVKAHQDELTALKAQLQKSRTELANASSKAQAQGKDIKSLRAKLEKAEQTAVTQGLVYSEEQARLLEENNLLLAQLFSVQEELEQRLLNQQTQPKQAEHKAEAKQAEHEIAAEREDPSGLPQEPTVSLLKRHLQKRAEQKSLKRKADELYKSPLFDAKWYLARNPDVAANKNFSKNPALHYLQFGGFEGRNPSPHFDSEAYLLANPDVENAGFNPLWHYLRFGKVEKRSLGYR